MSARKTSTIFKVPDPPAERRRPFAGSQQKIIVAVGAWVKGVFSDDECPKTTSETDILPDASSSPAPQISDTAPDPANPFSFRVSEGLAATIDHGKKFRKESRFRHLADASKDSR